MNPFATRHGRLVILPAQRAMRFAVGLAGALLGLAWVYKVLLGLFAQAMVGVFLRGLASSGARSWLGH